MNVQPNVEPIVPIEQPGRLSGKRSEVSRETNVQDDSARVQISDVAKDFSKAVQQLKGEEEVRPEEVRRGREIIDNWEEPTDEEVDVILNRLFEE